jgi:hypothetical protein
VLAVAIAPSVLMMLALGAVDSPGVQDARKSVAIVSGFGNQPATGFIVGWRQPLVYLVTARHVAYNADGVKAQQVHVMLNASICGEAFDAHVYNGDPDCDCAVISAPVPDGCREGITSLRSLPRTSLRADNAQPGTTMVALARASDGSVGPSRELVLQQWDSTKILLRSPTDEGMSGGLLLTSDGEVVGMIQGTESKIAHVTEFASIMNNSRFNTVPFNLAGKHSGATLRGYPSGAQLTVDGVARIDLGPSPRSLPFPPGLVRLTITAPDYDPVEDRVNIIDGDEPTRCVTMVKSYQRKIAKIKWPLVGATVALLGASAVSFKLGSDSKDSFFDMPTGAQRETANSELALGWDLLYVAGGVGALSVAAFMANGFALSPNIESSVKDCSGR